MLVENATLTVTSGQSPDIDAALARVAAYLERSAHCEGYLLTRDLTPEPAYLLSATWDAPRWRALAWRYFADVFSSAGIEYRATLTASVLEREAMPSASARR